MNHRKRKQSENQKKIKKERSNLYSMDSLNSFCPYCGEKGKPCSHIDSMARAYARGACKNKYKKTDT